MKSQSILSGRHEMIHWECVDTEKAGAHETCSTGSSSTGILFHMIPASCGNFAEAKDLAIFIPD